MQRNYSTKKAKKEARESLTDILGGKKNCIAMAIFAAIVIGGGIILMTIQDAKAKETQWIGSIPMANQNIEWYYAGKGWE